MKTTTDVDTQAAILDALPDAAALLWRLPKPAAGALLIAVIDYATANSDLVTKDTAGAAHRCWEAIRVIVYDPASGATLDRTLSMPGVDSPVLLVKHLLDTVSSAVTLRETLTWERDRIDRALAKLPV